MDSVRLLKIGQVTRLQARKVIDGLEESGVIVNTIDVEDDLRYPSPPPMNVKPDMTLQCKINDSIHSSHTLE